MDEVESINKITVMKSMSLKSRGWKHVLSEDPRAAFINWGVMYISGLLQC